MAQNIYAPLEGQIVGLSGNTGPFRVCPYCGNTSARVSLGKGPHLASLVCIKCGKHLAWLSRSHLTALLAQKKGAA